MRVQNRYPATRLVMGIVGPGVYHIVNAKSGTFMDLSGTNEIDGKLLSSLTWIKLMV